MENVEAEKQACVQVRSTSADSRIICSLTNILGIGAWEISEVKVRACTNDPSRIILVHVRNSDACNDLPNSALSHYVQKPDSALLYDSLADGNKPNELHTFYDFTLKYGKHGKLKVRRDADGQENGEVILVVLFPSEGRNDVTLDCIVGYTQGWSMVPGDGKLPARVPTQWNDGSSKPLSNGVRQKKPKEGREKQEKKKTKKEKKKSAGKKKKGRKLLL